MTQNNTLLFSRGKTGKLKTVITLFNSQNFTRKSFFSLLIAPIFLSLFLFSTEATATCYVELPTLMENSGCAQASQAPYSPYGTVEFMWAKNNNGSITPVTGWSTNTSLTYCPSSSGYYRMCARKVGCSAIYETPDVYVNPGGGGGGNCYKIKTKACGKFLDISGNSSSNGANLIQWPSTGGLNQRFTFDHLGNGIYRIIAVHSGKVLEAKNGGTSNGTEVVQGEWYGYGKQKWKIYDHGNGYYMIKNKKSGKYMDFYGNCGDGSKIELWPYYGDSYQKLKLIQTSDCGAVCDGQITSVKINALDGGSDFTITDGATYSSSQLPSNWNIEAMVSGSVESVKYTISGDLNDTHTENYEPYRYPTDNASANFGAGTYTINVKAFQGNNCSGELCDEKTITIHITEVCTGDITALIFDDLGGGADITITNGGTYTIDELPASFRLEALVTGEHESLGWAISGDIFDTHVENHLPYTYPGGSSTALTLGVGTYTAHATLYAGANLTGAACDELSVTFNIVEDNICTDMFPGGGVGLGAGGLFSQDEVCNTCSDAGNDPVIIVSTSAPDAGGEAVEVVWIKRSGVSNIGDCNTNDLAPINVGIVYNNFIAAGGFGVADPQIEDTDWMFVTDFDGDDLSLTLDCIEESTCFLRCARIVGCDRFMGESNAIYVEVNNVEGGQIGLLAGGAPVLTSTAFCAGEPVPVIGNGVSPSAPNGVEIVWLRTVADGGDPTAKVGALAAVNVGQLYDNYIAGGMTSPFVFVPNSDVVWEFITDGDANDEELALATLDQSYHFMRCVREIGDVRFCGESIPMPVTIYVEDCTPSPQDNPCTWERCNGVITLTGTAIVGINLVQVLDADDPNMAAIFECGTFLSTSCPDPITVNLPNPNGNVIIKVVCDDGDHYDYIANDCNPAPLVDGGSRPDGSDLSESELSVGVSSTANDDNDFDRSRVETTSERLFEFEIFPNPARDEVFVGLNAFAGKAAQISVLNSLGQILVSNSVDALPEGKIRVDLSNLTTGIYFIRMEVEGEEELTKRLVVNKGN